MPEIQYLPDLSMVRRHFWITSHMLFPDSPETAFTYFVRNLVGTEMKELGQNEEVKLPMEWVRALAFGAGINELIELENQHTRAGVTAGLVLVMVFEMAAGQYDRPSLNKAAHLIETIARRKKEQGVQIDHHTDRKEILNAWKLMKNSAHFWAALEWIFGPYDSGVLDRVAIGEEAQREFLRIACSFRQFGCGYRGSNTKEKKPFLDFESSLRLPDEIERTAYAVPEIKSPQWIVDILKEYRAPLAL